MDTELYELLTELGRAGYLIHTYQLDQHGPLVCLPAEQRRAPIRARRRGP